MADTKVAVVVVHGVADQKPAESARQIANLLTDLCPLGTYSTFQEEKIRIPVEPVQDPKKDASPGSSTENGTSHGWPYDEREASRRSVFEERNVDAILRHRGKAPDAEPEQGFMRDQLRYYEVEGERVFETVRLDGHRNQAGCDVHVYEAYWADLSSLGRDVITFFDQFYQLLLHLPSLGRNAVDYGRAANKNARLWPLFSWMHRWSIRWLTLFIVAVNLAIASLVVPVFVPRLLRPELGPCAKAPAQPCRPIPTRAGFETKPYVPVVVPVLANGLAALVAFVLMALALHRRRRPPAWLWTALPFLTAAGGWLAAAWVGQLSGAPRLLLFEAWLISAFLIGALLGLYKGMRPGAFWVGVVLLGATGLKLAFLLRNALVEEGALTEVVVQVAQLLDIALQLTWGVHILWLLLTIVVGILCAATTQKTWWRRAWNTAWTSRFTLTLPTALFANLTLVLWTAVFKLVQVTAPPQAAFRPLPIWTWLVRLLDLHMGETTIAEYLKQTLMVGASRAFILITVVLGFFVLGAVWSILPSVLVESSPRKTQDSSNRAMRALGVWLTRGLNFIPGVAELFTFLVVAVLFLAACHPVADPTSWKAISASAALLLALIGARFWMPGASAALDVMLDVDNYLRQHPTKNTTRARIAARCASVLEFILKRERCGHDYKSVIIVAHSQGTMIMADLLRFLKLEGHHLSGDLASKSPAFFTMGNPLRQMYARVFPGLYPWVWQAKPTADDIGVTEWVNAYFSGDYVGRTVWRDPSDPSAWDRRKTDTQFDCDRPAYDQQNHPDIVPGTTREMCLGEGAHTHYWDEHGSDVAWVLDDLIAARCRAKS